LIFAHFEPLVAIVADLLESDHWTGELLAGECASVL
jgi:hypothetical protein